MNNDQTSPSNQANLAKLERLYVNKCLQVEKAKTLSNSFMYQVLKAEAENIRFAIDHS